MQATVKSVKVRGVHNAKQIAFMVEYADPTRDAADAATLEFMVGDKKAHFAHGQLMAQVRANRGSACIGCPVYHHPEGQKGAAGMSARNLVGGAISLAVAAAVGLPGCGLFESEQVAMGRKLFAYYCVHCHGEKGQGNGFNAKRLDPKPRDLTDKHEEFMGMISNEQIYYEVISRDMMSQQEFDEKYGENTDKLFTPPIMPTFKYTLSEEERWALVAFVRTLHKNDAPKVEIPAQASKERPKVAPSPEPTLVSAPADLEKLAERGKTLYEDKYGCVACHAINGKGGEVGVELDRAGARLGASSVYRWIKYPQAIKPHTKMPNLGVSDDDALAITAYLGTLRAGPPSGEPAAVPQKAAAK